MAKNSKTMNTILVSAFMMSMVGLLIYAYKKSRSVADDVLSETGEHINTLSSVAESFTDKFLSKLGEAEQKLKSTKEEGSLNVRTGEYGLFL